MRLPSLSFSYAWPVTMPLLLIARDSVFCQPGTSKSWYAPPLRMKPLPGMPATPATSPASLMPSAERSGCW